jgi:predicted secreted protein
MEYKRPGGDISTLLDLTNRDQQDNDFFPLKAEKTWFERSVDRRNIPFVPVIQDFPFRGPASYGHAHGQRFTFDIGSLPCGDIMFGAAIEVKLNHWLDLTTQLNISTGAYTYDTPYYGSNTTSTIPSPFFFANSIGSILIEKAELEIEGVTIETIDGDFIYTYGRLNTNLNQQFGLANDSLGLVSTDDLLTWNPKRNYSIEDGNVFCFLPFFFMRARYRESLPMVALKEGSAKIHVTFRPFEYVVRQLRGYRDLSGGVALNSNPIFPAPLPLGLTFSFNNGTIKKTIPETPLDFQQVKLITYGAYLDGLERNKMLREPFEHMIREVQTFYFDEPLKYAISKTSNDTITIQLPLEANHPLEEIVWFIRRKETRNNNEHTNYSSVIEREYDPIFNNFSPLLKNAKLQVNGITICDAPEVYYRQLISNYHKGGISSFSKFIYGYPFARHPSEEHQPSGSLNASRVQNIRLTLEVQPPVSQYDTSWEVKVYCIGLNWLRFENGIGNKLFTD